MAKETKAFTWKDRITEIISRPYRLAFWILLFGLAFAMGRFWFFLAFAIYAFAGGIRLKKTGAGWVSGVVIILATSFFVLHMISFGNSKEIEKYIDHHTPINVSGINDGLYTGRGQGNNGEIEVAVRVKNGKIANIETMANRDPVYAFDHVIEYLEGKSSTKINDVGGYVFRNRESVYGFIGAVENALLKARSDFPEQNKLSRATFFFTENSTGRIFLNTLAILFIAIITFDFFIQPTLAKGTGQSLNCYNCQACVGACPVKMVEGEPFPMIMVTEARAGNYEKVAGLAKYCVGCGKCASKCPVGNSGPTVAGAGYQIWKEGIVREKRNEKTLLNRRPTIDQISQKQEKARERENEKQ